MANHGWLPHHGRNITLAMLTQGLVGAFAFDATPPPAGVMTFAEMLFAASISDVANPSNTSFDLDTINTHNAPIEFDGSLSRKDHFFGSDVVFDNATWETQWQLFEQEGFVDGTYIDLSVAATARARHVLLKSQAGNPEFLFTNETLSKSSGTTALYMMVLGGATGVVNKDWVWALFGGSSPCTHTHFRFLLSLTCSSWEDTMLTKMRCSGWNVAEERIPYNEGFTPRENVSVVELESLISSIISAAPTDLLCSFNPDMPCPGSGSSSADGSNSY